jgi:hypothetical protein
MQNLYICMFSFCCKFYVQVLVVPKFVMEAYVLMSREWYCADFSTPDGIKEKNNLINGFKDNYFCYKQKKDCLYDIEFRTEEKKSFNGKVTYPIVVS